MNVAEANAYHDEKAEGAERLMAQYRTHTPNNDLQITVWGNIAIELQRGAPSCPYTSTLLFPGTKREDCPACAALTKAKEHHCEEWELKRANSK